MKVKRENRNLNFLELPGDGHPSTPESLEIYVNYFGNSSCHRGTMLDRTIMPLLAAASEMLAVLEESVSAYEKHRDGEPTGHLWPDPNHIFHARKIIKEVRGGD